MDIRQVTETIAMIEEQNFDIRTITMGISLLDCIDPDIDKAADKIYEKVTTKAANLVAVGDEIAAGFIGANYIKYLLHKKYVNEDIKIIVLDALSYQRKLMRQVR